MALQRKMEELHIKSIAHVDIKGNEVLGES